MIDTERYGGRRAFLTHIVERTKTFVGCYSQLMKVDWDAVERLVFVCKGNICRSPYAEVRARQLGLESISMGIEASDGALANPKALFNAAQRQVDLSDHRSRKLRGSLWPGDLVMFFEPQHLMTYQAMAYGQPVPASLLGLWATPARPFISDPYGKSDRYFQECFSVVDSGLRSIAEHMRRN